MESFFFLSQTEIINSKLEHPRKNMHRDDVSIFLDKLDDGAYPNKKNICETLYDRLNGCYLDYTKEYGQLDPTVHRSTLLKIQKTSPKGGFHSWHYERLS